MVHSHTYSEDYLEKGGQKWNVVYYGGKGGGGVYNEVCFAHAILGGSGACPSPMKNFEF